MNRISTLLFTVVMIAIGVHSLSASESENIAWKDLTPGKLFEDPFENLSQEQLQDLGYLVRVRSLIAADKLKPDGPDAQEATKVEKRLENAGLDIQWLLTQRRHVHRLREKQGNSVQPDLDGRAVQLAGFIVPLKKSRDLVTEFLFIPEFDACSHATPPPPNQTVYVHSPEGIASRGPETVVRVSGTIKVRQTTVKVARLAGPLSVSAAYAIEPTKIEVYKGDETGDQTSSVATRKRLAAELVAVSDTWE